MEQEAFYIKNSKHKKKVKGPKRAAIEESDNDDSLDIGIHTKNRSKKQTVLSPTNDEAEDQTIRAFIVPGARSPTQDKYF